MSATIEIAGKEVPRLGFGAMRVPWAVGPDGQPDREASKALVRRAVELGVRFIDTANVYARGGSEEIIAEALHPYEDDLLVATKGGLVSSPPAPEPPNGPQALAGDARQFIPEDGLRLSNFDGSPEGLKAACDLSLRRLRLDVIDLYQFHGQDPTVPFDESIGALAELRLAGKIRHIGLSNVGRREIASALALTPIASVQNRYNLEDRASEKVLEMCEQNGIAFIPWGPLQVGDDKTVAAVAAKHGATARQVALAWLLARSPAMLPIPGTSSIQHLEENAAAVNISLDHEDVEVLSGHASTSQ